MKQTILALLFVLTLSTLKAVSLDPPPRELLTLLSVLDIKHDGTLSTINAIFQKEFLRKPGQERWEMEDVFEEKREQILPLLEKLGVFDAVYPKEKHYDTILIHGATVGRMRTRVKFLDDLWSQGIRADEIVFLAGERPLDPKLESEERLYHQDQSDVRFRPGWKASMTTPTTEAEAAPFVWDQVVTNDDLRSRKVHYVFCPMIKDLQTGKIRRPSREDTINAWLLMRPPQGRYLAISNNPYIFQQHQATLNVFHEYSGEQGKYTFETVGSAEDGTTSIAVHLDNIARWIYSTVK